MPITKYLISDLDQSISRFDLEIQAAKGATLLATHGVKHDDRVAIIMRNDLTSCEVMRAVALAGAVAVQINWHGTKSEIFDILEDCKPTLIIIHRDLITKVKVKNCNYLVVGVTPPKALQLAYKTDSQEIVKTGNIPEWSLLRDTMIPIVNDTYMRPMMRYTSGSTGKPKGIIRVKKPNKNGPIDYYKTLRFTATEMFSFTPGAHFMTAAPLYHSGPSTLSAMAMAMEEMSMTILPRFDPIKFLEAIENYRVTHIYLVPTMMIRLLKLPKKIRQKYDISSVKFCVSTGSPWPHDVKVSMIDWWGPVFWETYGASELGFLTLASSQESVDRPGTVGRIQLGGSIKIYDTNKTELPMGQVGDIYIKTEAFGQFHYSNDFDSNQKLEIDGYISVGDMGWVDSEGYLFVTDRKKDMIISGGVNIFPVEIEEILFKAPFIADVAVFGAPDPEFGEQIVAAIQPVVSWTGNEAEVLTWLEGKLANFKHPKIISFHKTLPREDSGKIFKTRLRMPYWTKVNRSI